MEDKFKLDYCYKCGNITVFAYKGIEGSWDEEAKLLKYMNKEYQGDWRKIDASELFTVEDMDFLIALNNGIFIDDLPFKLESGEITHISLNGNWLVFQGIAILANSENSQFFRVDGDKLFVDEKEVDYQKQCTIHEHSYGKVRYGIPFSWKDTARIIAWPQLKAGCRVSYIEELLQFLPLEDSSLWFTFSQSRYEYDTRDYLFYDNKLSKIPINKVVDCRWKVDRLIARVDYKIKKASKLHGFKPLQRWKDGTTYVTSFFFYDRIGFLYQYVDGRFSVAYEDHTYDITDEYFKKSHDHDLYDAIQEYIKEKR